MNTFGWERVAHLVFVDYPASGFFIFALVKTLVFDYLVYGYVLKACRPCELLCVCRLSYTWSACDYDVGVCARHGRCYESRELSQRDLLAGG
jgi:hypothetical protein